MSNCQCSLYKYTGVRSPFDITDDKELLEVVENLLIGVKQDKTFVHCRITELLIDISYNYPAYLLNVLP